MVPGREGLNPSTPQSISRWPPARPSLARHPTAAEELKYIKHNLANQCIASRNQCLTSNNKCLTSGNKVHY